MKFVRAVLHDHTKNVHCGLSFVFSALSLVRSGRKIPKKRETYLLKQKLFFKESHSYVYSYGHEKQPCQISFFQLTFSIRAEAWSLNVPALAGTSSYACQRPVVLLRGHRIHTLVQSVNIWYVDISYWWHDACCVYFLCLEPDGTYISCYIVEFMLIFVYPATLDICVLSVAYWVLSVEWFIVLLGAAILCRRAFRGFSEVPSCWLFVAYKTYACTEQLYLVWFCTYA